MLNLLAAVTLAFSAVAPADTIPTAIRDTLDAANRAFSAALVSGNGPAVHAAYTPDAILHPPGGGVITGGNSVAAFWGPGRPGAKLGHRLEPTLRRMLGTDAVLEMGRWHDRPNRGEGNESPWNSGCYTVIWRRGADHVWRLAYDGWTAPMEDPAACRPRS